MFHKSVMGRGVATHVKDVTLADYIARKQDKPKLTFDEWWDDGVVSSDNPYTPDSAAFWAFAGWIAALENSQ